MQPLSALLGDSASQTATEMTDFEVYVNRTATGVTILGSGTDDTLQALGTDDSGNVYACGYFDFPGATTAAAYKFDPSGADTWSASIPAARGNIGRECRVTGDGQLAFATQLKPSASSNQQQTGLYTWDAAGNPDFAEVFLAGGSGFPPSLKSSSSFDFDVVAAIDISDVANKGKKKILGIYCFWAVF